VDTEPDVGTTVRIELPTLHVPVFASPA